MHFKFVDTSLTLSMTSKLCLLGYLTDFWLLAFLGELGFARSFGFAFVALVSALLSWLFGLARLLARLASLSAAQNLFLG